MLVMVRAHFCEIDGRVQGGCCLGFGVTARVHLCEMDGRVLGGCCLLRCSGGLLEVLVCNHPPVFRYVGSMLV